MHVVITGASKGIGFETTRIFLETGDAHVHAIARDTAPLLSLKSSLAEDTASRLFLYPFDLNCDSTAYSDLVKKVQSRTSQINILINNAGLLIHKPFADITTDELDAMLAVNLKAPFMLTQHLLPFMTTHSHIVNISSMGGFQGSIKFPGLSAYSASKGGLAILTECLAEELKARHIYVNALALGAVQTEMLSKAFPGYTAPLSADEAASFIARFAMEGHRFFNGKILPVSLSTP